MKPLAVRLWWRSQLVMQSPNGVLSDEMRKLLPPRSACDASLKVKRKRSGNPVTSRRTGRSVTSECPVEAEEAPQPEIVMSASVCRGRRPVAMTNVSVDATDLVQQFCGEGLCQMSNAGTLSSEQVGVGIYLHLNDPQSRSQVARTWQIVEGHFNRLMKTMMAKDLLDVGGNLLASLLSYAL